MQNITRKKELIYFINNQDKKHNSMKININSNESKAKLYNTKMKLNLKDINSERDNIIVIKKARVSSPKEEKK